MSKTKEQLRLEAQAAMAAGVIVKKLPDGPKPPPMFAKGARVTGGLTVGQANLIKGGHHKIIGRKGDDTKPPTPAEGPASNFRTQKRKARRKRKKDAAGKVKWATFSD